MKKNLFILTFLMLSVCSMAQISFPLATYFPVGNTPAAVCSADFNADGIKDMASANVGSNNISILLGLGGGVFSAPTNIAAYAVPYCIISADFNADGKMDLAAGNGNVATVSIFLGNGLGGFSAFTNYNVGVGPRGLFVADFNNDGNKDIVTANSNSHNMSVLLGNGLGSFTLSATVVAGNTTNGVFSADFNGDGNFDIVGANFNANNLSVALGNGNGTFSLASNYVVGSGPTGVTCALLNNDNFIDIVSCNYDFSTISVLLGVGNGTFSAPTTFPTGYYPLSIINDDFNGDGELDIAMTGLLDTVTVLLGTGTGGFSIPYNFPSTASGDQVITADFNNDGKPDLATANNSTNMIAVLLNGTAFPLPVSLQSFSGTNTNGNNLIKWTTANENNCDYYTVQYSKDAINFSNVSNEASKSKDGNSSIPLSYSFLDKNSPNNHNYYRLLQTDFEGKEFICSNIIDIIVGLKSTEMNIYPNPIHQKITVEYNCEAETEVNIVISDINGSIVKNLLCQFQKGNNSRDIELSEMKPGIYLLNLTICGKIHHSKIIEKY